MMGRILMLSLVLVAWSCERDSTQTTQQVPTEQPATAPAPLTEEEFYEAGAAAKKLVDRGKTQEATRLAEQLLTAAPRFKGNWNYGNAIQDANIVLGRVALQEGRVDDAKSHILAAGNSPGSPQMNSFGPNMSLARDLINKGERDVVLEYFELCRRFWKHDRGQLERWTAEVKGGEMPNFGANLKY